MSKAMLKVIEDSMTELGINYEFKKWTAKPEYPYFTGEYQEDEPFNEDGEQGIQFILNGFGRGESALVDLENAKEKIKAYFPKVGGRLVTTESGSVVAIFYASSFNNLPTGDAELERIQINLTVKEWSVN